MKMFEFELDSYLLKNIPGAIRGKKDIIVLLLVTLQNILVKPLLTKDEVKLKIVINKMSRIFYHTPDKIISIVMPFPVKKEGNEIKIYDKVDKSLEINSMILNNLLYIITSFDNLGDCDLSETIDSFFEEEGIGASERSYLKRLVYELILTEYGYLRYEDDIEHENGDRHPRYHLDINATTDATFKVGLNEKMDLTSFIDILDITTDCKYLHKRLKPSKPRKNFAKI